MEEAETVSAEWLLDQVREHVDAPAEWDANTTIAEVRDQAGDLTMLIMISVCEGLSGEPWPLELIDQCDTIGMLADFADVKATRNGR